MGQLHNVIIREAYKDYVPPIDVKRTVHRLLDGVPERHLAGLKNVVLANAGGLSRVERRRKTKSRGRDVQIAERRGYYAEQRRNSPAHIQLHVDHILFLWPVWLLKIPVIQDSLVADVLFHELGHHIHKTQAPEHRERENVAEDWKRRLSRRYFLRNYWYLTPVYGALWLAAKPIRPVLKRYMRRAEKEYARSKRHT